MDNDMLCHSFRPGEQRLVLCCQVSARFSRFVLCVSMSSSVASHQLQTFEFSWKQDLNCASPTLQHTQLCSTVCTAIFSPEMALISNDVVEQDSSDILPLVVIVSLSLDASSGDDFYGSSAWFNAVLHSWKMTREKKRRKKNM